MTAALLRRVMRSGYTIVAIGVVGFILINLLQSITEGNRAKAFAYLQNAQNAQSALGLLAKNVWELRSWDTPAQTLPGAESAVEREAIKAQITQHVDAFARYALAVQTSQDFTVLSRSAIDDYIRYSDLSFELSQKQAGSRSDDINAALSARTSSFGTLNKNLDQMSLALITLQSRALRDFEQARQQSNLVLVGGTVSLGLLFLISGIVATRGIRLHERRLEESEAKLRDFAAASSDTLVELDAQFNIMSVSRVNEGTKRFDKTRAVVGRSFFDSASSPTSAPLRKLFSQQRSFRDFEARLPGPTGKVSWRRLNGIAVFDAAGAFAGYRLTIVDITTQKNLEAEVHSRQMLYEQLAEQVPGAVFVSSMPPGRPAELEYVSPSFTTMTGFSRQTANEELRAGRTIVDREEQQKALAARAQNPQRVFEIKTRIRRADQKHVPVIFSSRMLPQGPKGEKRVLGLLIDISALEAAEDAMRARERQLTSILSNIGQAYFYSCRYAKGFIDPLFISASVEQVMGYTPTEWMEIVRGGVDSMMQLLPEENHAQASAMISLLQSGSEAFPRTFESAGQRLRKNGQRFWSMTRAQNTRLEDGSILQEGMVIDVSADRERQLELVRLKAAVDEASDGIAIWQRGPSGSKSGRKLLYANKTALGLIERISGSFDPAGNLWEIAHSGTKFSVTDHVIEGALIRSGSWGGQIHLACKDGSTIFADLSITRIDPRTDIHVFRDNTAIKKLEVANENTRAELQDVIQALDRAGEGIAITHPLQDIVYANKSFAMWLGEGDPKNIVGHKMVDLIEASDPPLSQIAEEMKVALAAGGVYSAETAITVRKNHATRILRWSVSQLSDGRWVNVSRDVTDARAIERKRAALDRSVAEIASRRDISRSSPKDVFELILKEVGDTMDVKRIGLWRMKSEGAGIQSILLIQAGEVITKSISIARDGNEPYFENLQSMRSMAIQDAQNDPATICLTGSYLKPNGIISMLDVPILWQGDLWGVLCVEHIGPLRRWDDAEVTYVTYMADLIAMTLDRIARDEAQARIEHLYQENASILSALDSTQERIIIEDSSGYIRYVNQAVADAWGRGSKADILGRPFLSAFPLLQAYRRSLETEVRDAIAAKGTWTGQLLLTRPSGEPAYVDIRVMELPDHGLLYTAEDVTDRRKHEQREQQLKTQLIEAQKMESIGRLAGGVAHDFNNIIAAVRAFASLVGSEVQAGTKAQLYSDRIINTCDRAAELVRQILLFSRASRAELKPMNLNEVVEEVTAYLRASIPASVTLDIVPPRPEAIINGNAGQLVQVLMNLGINARDAIGDKPGRVHITFEERKLSGTDVANYKPGLSISRTGRTDGVIVHQFVLGAPLPDQDYLCLTVRDNGPGMSGITVERMFEPFFTTKEKARGTGLGLPVVAAVVAAHTGFIVVTTQQGRGCRFNIFLPMTKHAAESQTAERQDLAAIRGSERVLLIDDESDLADATALLLRKFGYDVAPLYYPKDALRLFSEDPKAWDVIITDQVMPEMKGLELIVNMKKVRPEIPAILCTGYSDYATERTAMATGADAFFTKPVSPEILALAIRKVCDAERPRA